MKVFLHYEEPAAQSLHSTIKITLPKKWEKGPASNLIETFVKDYNKKHPENPLEASELRLEDEMRNLIRGHDAVFEKINDRADLYIKVGAAPAPQRVATAAYTGDPLDKERVCKLFGCNKKYTERGNVDGDCQHHTGPPVFHETAKYWSCCPQKKAYDWESFMEIKGCARGKHSDIKPGSTAALGGMDLRGGGGGATKLKTAADFNREQAGAVEPKKPLDALKDALILIGCSQADFDSALAALKTKFADDEKEIIAEFATEFGFGLHNLIGTTGSGPPPPQPP